MFATIQSNNIVGYQNKESLGESYFTFVVPTFNTVSGNDMKLGDIKLSYSGDDATMQKIWTLSIGGATKDDYYYVNEAAAEFEECEVGWYTNEVFTPDNKADDVSLPYGQGFALVAADKSTGVVFAGQVMATDACVDTLTDMCFTFTGNCMPQALKLGDIALIYSGDDATMQKVWTLSIGGATKQSYYYVNEAAADFEECEVGWYNSEIFSPENLANDVEVPAGMGFAIAAQDKIQLLIPTPIKK